MSVIAEQVEEREHLSDRIAAVVMEARRGPEDYWLVLDSADRLEIVIPFDSVVLDERDDGTISTIKFHRSTGQWWVETGQIEGGRADWGDEIVDALEEIRDERGVLA